LVGQERTVKKAECSKCGADARIVRGDYEFNETGLRDIVLLDIQQIRCGKCGNVDPILSGVDDLMDVIALAILQKQFRLKGEELRFLRKNIGLGQEEFSELLHVDKTTLSKWENNEDPIGIQSDLWARTVVISHKKSLEKRAADHIRAFEKIADERRHVRVEIDAEKLEYEYA
jgi:transcriptional regulator with XRE-family HTH domain